MSNARILPMTVVLSFLGACADVDSVLFVTGTNLGIDADSKPPNVAIGYDRNETFIGPNYESETGAIPSVVGRLESDLAVFNPAIQQVYATGNAARLVTLPPEQGDAGPDGAIQEGQGKRALAPDEDKRLVFFRTNSNVGLKVTFGEAVYPESFSFGYKRKELSFIPLVEVVEQTPSGTSMPDRNGQGNATDVKEVYGSVLASIGVKVRTPSFPETGLGVSQFFATGVAADQLARYNDDIKDRFQTIAREAFEAYEREVARQERQAIDALVCYQAIPASQKMQVWENAAALGLLGNDPEQLSKLKEEYEAALAAQPEEVKEKQLAEVNRKYGMLIGVARGAEAERAALLEQHANFVCDLRGELADDPE